MRSNFRCGRSEFPPGSCSADFSSTCWSTTMTARDGRGGCSSRPDSGRRVIPPGTRGLPSAVRRSRGRGGSDRRTRLPANASAFRICFLGHTLCRIHNGDGRKSMREHSMRRSGAGTEYFHRFWGGHIGKIVFSASEDLLFPPGCVPLIRQAAGSCGAEGGSPDRRKRTGMERLP